MKNIVKGYVLEGKSGAGAMGQVYRARHRSLDRIAAVKVMHSHLLKSGELRQRFCNEARAMSGLSHPNIVSMYDFVDEGNTLALIMEFIDGKPLDEIITQETGAIPHERALHLFKQMLEGMSYAHARGMIHRDIKPSNIMITGDDKVKILDLGLALAEDSKRVTQVGAKMGTMYYMAPELLEGPNHSVRSDIYALAMTLYEMLSGAMPLDSEEQSDFMIMNRILKEELPDPREYYPYIPEWLVQMLKKCLKKNANERFSSCDEILICIENNEGNDEFSGDSELIDSPFSLALQDSNQGYCGYSSTSANSSSNVIMRSVFALIGSFFIYLIALQLVLGVFD